MKKFLLLLLFVLISISQLYADQYSFSLTASLWKSNGPQTQTINNVEWNLTKTDNVADYYGYDGTRGQQVGSGSSEIGGIISLSTSDIEGTITSITVNSALNSNQKATIAVSVGNVSYGSYLIDKANSSTATDYEFRGNSSGEIIVNWTLESKTAIYFKSITIEYVHKATSAPTSITFNPMSGSEISAEDPISISSSDATSIIYSIDNETGTYSNYLAPFKLEEGEHIVYAKAWNSVNENNPITEKAHYTVCPSVTFDFINNAYGLPNNGQTFAENGTILSSGPAKMKILGEQNSAWRYYSDGLRAYNLRNPSFVLSVDGAIITKVVLETTNTFYVKGYNNDNNTKEWIGEAEDVTFICSSSNNNSISKISISYKLQSGPKIYNPKFENIEVELGKSTTITPTVPTPDGLVINYTIDSGSDFINLDGNKITGISVGEATIKATWGGGDSGYEQDEANISVNVMIVPTEDPGLSFRYSTIYGKKDVGFLSQAAYHVSPGNIRYWSVNPEVADVDPATGMYISGSACNAGITTIYAEIEACGIYKYGKEKYDVIIESMEPDGPATQIDDAKFSFSNAEDLSALNIPYTTQNGTGSSDFVDKDYTVNNVTFTVSKSEGSTNSPKIWYNNEAYSLRLYKDNTLTFSLNNDTDHFISSIKFEIDNKSDSNTYLETTEINGDTQTGSSDRIYWNTSTKKEIQTIDYSEKENKVKKVTLTSSGKFFLKAYTVFIGSTVNPEDDLIHYNLYFNDSDRIVNAFVGDRIMLPELYKEDGFNENVEITYELDDPEGEEFDCNFYEALDDNGETRVFLEGVTEGIYTVRAKSEKSEEYKQLPATAILRLNVFPYLSVVPNNPGQLADDERTEAQGLTLTHTDEEGGEIATIALPKVDELLTDENGAKYSTISVGKVTIEHAGTTTVYAKNATNYEDEYEEYKSLATTDGNVYDIAEMPDTFEFTEDGTVTYTILYADTQTYCSETKVNVVLMPQVPTMTSDETEKTYTVTPSKNAMLFYHARTLSDTNNKPRKSVQIDEYPGWTTSDEAAEDGSVTFSRPDGLASTDNWAIDYRSLKDISAYVADGQNPYVVSNEAGRIVINGNGTLVGVEDVAVDGADSEVVFFNLQGIRMSEPLTPGVYIRQCGTTAEKVFIR